MARMRSDIVAKLSNLNKDNILETVMCFDSCYVLFMTFTFAPPL